MKKIYIAPEMDVVELDMFQPILTQFSTSRRS